MEAPKCKLCGNRHWKAVCPRPTKAAGAAVKEIENRPVKPSAAGAAKKAAKVQRGVKKTKKRKAQTKKAKTDASS